MCLGKTVLASALGGPLEIIVPGSGLLFDPARPADVAQLLSQASSNAGLRAELGRGARVRADVFSVRALLDGTQAAYDDVLRRPNRGAPDPITAQAREEQIGH
jgi:glycosyltransferase involved in cell wall biosynthesis